MRYDIKKGQTFQSGIFGPSLQSLFSEKIDCFCCRINLFQDHPNWLLPSISLEIPSHPYIG